MIYYGENENFNNRVSFWLWSPNSVEPVALCLGALIRRFFSHVLQGRSYSRGVPKPAACGDRFPSLDALHVHQGGSRCGGKIWPPASGAEH